MPIIIKENRILENIDESSRKCLKTLNETLLSDNLPQAISSMNSSTNSTINLM